MPLHDYKCQDCGGEFEELVSGDQVPACPSCGDKHVDKLLSAHAVGTSHSGSAATAPPCAGGGCGLGGGSCQFN